MKRKFIMYTFHLLVLCCCASKLAVGVVLRDFPSTRNTISEAQTESLKTKSTILDSNIATKDTDTDPKIGLQGSMHFPEKDSSLYSASIEDDRVNVPDELIVHSFVQSDFENEEFENDDNASFQLLPAAGFEFLIASEALKKANVIEELASSIGTPLENISDEDDFNALFIAEENDCEEIHTVQFKDSETENDSLHLLSMENTNDSLQFMATNEASRSLDTDYVLLNPDGTIENFRETNTIFQNVKEGGIHFSIENASSSEMETTNVGTDFFLFNPDGSLQPFPKNNTMFEDFNESLINFSSENVSSSEIETINLELGNHFPPEVQHVVSAPSKVPEMIEVVTEKLTEKNPVVSTSNESLLVEMNEVIQTNSTNLMNNETLVTDSGVAISEEKKCPPAGFCLFSFIFRDTCTEHSDCRGNRLCCKSGCSKKCLDL